MLNAFTKSAENVGKQKAAELPKAVAYTDAQLKRSQAFGRLMTFVSNDNRFSIKAESFVHGKRKFEAIVVILNNEDDGSIYCQSSETGATAIAALRKASIKSLASFKQKFSEEKETADTEEAKKKKEKIIEEKNLNPKYLEKLDEDVADVMNDAGEAVETVTLDGTLKERNVLTGTLEEMRDQSMSLLKALSLDNVPTADSMTGGDFMITHSSKDGAQYLKVVDGRIAGFGLGNPPRKTGLMTFKVAEPRVHFAYDKNDTLLSSAPGLGFCVIFKSDGFEVVAPLEEEPSVPLYEAD